MMRLTSHLALSSLALSAGLAATAPARAQQVSCGLDVSAADVPLVLRMQEEGRYELPFGNRSMAYVPVVFHVIRRSDGTGGLSDDRINIGLADANAMWENSGAEIQFCKQGSTRYIDDTDAYDVTSWEELDAVRQRDVVPNAINVYCVNSIVAGGGSWAGMSSFTWSPVQGILLDNHAVGVASDRVTVAHELGHYFDLLHTHETALGVECDEPNHNGLCWSTGDLVCDTPADPNLSGRLDTNCFYTGGGSDPCGHPYYPDTSNLMSYGRRACLYSFTPQQMNRARATLHNFRPALIHASCEDICRVWRPTTGPAMANSCVYMSAVHDSVRHKTYLMGLGQFQEFDGLTWTSRFENQTPVNRYEAGAAFDSVRGVTIFFGGQQNGGPASGETWEFNGTTWRRAAITGPTPRLFPAMAYDPDRRVTLLYGGSGDAGNPANETWEWNGVRWTQRFPMTVPTGAGGAMAFDPVRRMLIMYNGTTGDTVGWTGQDWTLLADNGLAEGPGARYYHAMATDTARGTVLLSGGYSDNSPAEFLYEWNGSAWRRVAAQGDVMMRPNPVWVHAMTFDPTRGTLQVLGGYTSAGMGVGGYWELGGCEAPPPPPPPPLPPPTGGGDFGTGDTIQLATIGGLPSPVYYQWRHNGVNLADDGRITGSQAQVLTILWASPTDSGDYDCTITAGPYAPATTPTTAVNVANGGLIHGAGLPSDGSANNPANGFVIRTFPAGTPGVVTRIHVTGTMVRQLAGDLAREARVRVIAPPTPEYPTGQMFTIVPTTVGAFDTLDIDKTFDLPAGDPVELAGQWQVRCFETLDNSGPGVPDKIWTTITVTLEPPPPPPACPADFNGDGFLDFFDFDAFTACFEGIECPPGKSADFNGDGFPDFFDFDDYVAAFEGGC